MRPSRIFAIALFLGSPQVQAASFDCAKAATTDEKLICLDSNLSALDEELSRTYKVAIGEIVEDKKKTLKSEQIAWIKERRKCTTGQCIESLIKDRILHLQNIGANSSELALVETQQIQSDEPVKFGNLTRTRVWDPDFAVQMINCRDFYQTQKKLQENAGETPRKEFGLYADAFLIAGAVAADGNFMKSTSSGLPAMSQVSAMERQSVKAWAIKTAQQCITFYSQIKPDLEKHTEQAIFELKEAGFKPLNTHQLPVEIDFAKSVLADSDLISDDGIIAYQFFLNKNQAAASKYSPETLEVTSAQIPSPIKPSTLSAIEYDVQFCERYGADAVSLYNIIEKGASQAVIGMFISSLPDQSRPLVSDLYASGLTEVLMGNLETNGARFAFIKDSCLKTRARHRKQ